MTKLNHSRKATTIAAALAAVVAVLGGVALAASGDESDGSGRSLVITAEAQRRTLTDSVTVKGTVGRVEQRQIVASAPADVTRVPVEDGTEVAAGSPLLSLDGRAAIAEEGEFPFFRSLDIGARGEDVRQLETILARAGFSPGTVDQSYTESTRTALAQWQARHSYPGATPERRETVTVSLAPSGGYAVGDRAAAAVTIEPPGVGIASANPELSIRSLAADAAEGSVATFRIDAEVVPDEALDVEVRLTSRSVDDADVVAPIGTFPLAIGQWSTTVTVPIRQDRLVEDDELLEVELVDGDGYQLDSGADTASTTIVDDDVPELTVSGGGRVAEGAVSTITVVADQAPTQALQVALGVTGDATAGRDYRSVEPVVLLPAGATSVSVPVTTLTDDTLEPDERVVVGLTTGAGQYRIGPAAIAVVTIAQAVGDAAVPTVRLRATSTSVQEGQPFPLVVSLDRPLTDELVLDLVYSGSAQEGQDYTPLGRVSVPAGQTSLALQVPTVQDDRVEPDRELVVALQAADRYRTASPSEGRTTIESDDLPELTIVAGAGSVGEGGGTSFRIVADQAPVEDISVAYQALGSATAGEDFDALTGTAILRAGQTSLDVPLLTLADDVQFEPTDMVVGHWPIRVGQVLVDQGDSVAAGTPLLSLTDSGLTVTLRATASDRTRLEPGQKVTVSLSGSTVEAEGIITELDETAQVDKETKEQFYEGTVDVAGLDAADGANVSIEVVLDQRDDALTVPIAAVRQNGSGDDVVRVLDLEAGGATEEVPVETGISEGSYIEVTSGLEGGEVVIVEVEEKP